MSDYQKFLDLQETREVRTLAERLRNKLHGEVFREKDSCLLDQEREPVSVYGAMNIILVHLRELENKCINRLKGM